MKPFPPRAIPTQTGNPRRTPSSEDGSTLLGVLTILTFLAAGLGMYLNSIGNIRRVQEQRIMNDRSLMAAEAGLAKAISKLNGMSTPPSSDDTWNMNLAADSFSPFQTVTVNVYPRTVSSQAQWTLVSTATYDNSDTRHSPLARRVQATMTQQNFARYESFVNDFGGSWTPGYFQFEGFDSVYLGPYHANSGVAFWPNLWMLKETTTAATGGVNTYANYGSYMSVYGNAAANSAVNILNYYDSNFCNAPKFYGGLTVLPKPISLPTDLNTDTRATQLRNNAGLNLPAGYTGYDATKGPNFAVEILSPTASSADSVIEVKQYLGTSGGAPSYGPTRTYNINTINNSMVVKGNVKSLKGVLNGKLTVAAFKTTELANAGNIDITGNLEYKSRKAISGFQYTDNASLYTADHSGINQSAVDTLLNQLNNVTDTLGLVAEKDVMIKERDLSGNLIAADMNVPLYIDAIVMATGASTTASSDGGFGVENNLTRAKGKSYFLGGTIQNYNLSWALYSGGVHTAGILCNRLWDQRAYKPGGSPPYFPTTGNLQFLSQSWRSTYVKEATDTAWIPN